MEPKQAYQILKNKTYKDDAEKQDLLNKIKTDPQYAYGYAQEVIGDRWPEAEEYIKKDPEWASFYAYFVIKGRFPEAEDIIKKDPIAGYYASCVIKDRWIEAEEIIKTCPENASYYIKEIIKGRWIEAEECIKTCSRSAYEYAKDVIQGRWIEAEPYIKTDSCWASCYARDVMNDENFWERREEELLLNDPLKVINEIHQSRVKEQERKIEQERERERQRIEQELERERQEAIRLQNIADKHQRLKDWLQKIESVVDEHNIDVSSLIPNQDQDFDEIQIKENITKYVGQNIPVMV